ncbi:hypothetical protein [Fischerella thermalis]
MLLAFVWQAAVGFR